MNNVIDLSNIINNISDHHNSPDITASARWMIDVVLKFGLNQGQKRYHSQFHPPIALTTLTLIFRINFTT